MARVFIDMDGVLCKYNIDAEVSDYERDGYFRELEPRVDMLEAVKYLNNTDLAEVFILSSVLPQKEQTSIQEKNEWIDMYLSEIDDAHRIFPLCGTNKADAVKSFCDSDILCDDYSSNLFSWVESGGKGIKILNEINGLSGAYNLGPRLRVVNAEDLFYAVAAIA